MRRPGTLHPRPWEPARGLDLGRNNPNHPPGWDRPAEGQRQTGPGPGRPPRDPRCARCRRETDTTILSMFNTEELCLDCKEREEHHPRYEEARRTEAEAVRHGDTNFPGIGRPEDLR